MFPARAILSLGAALGFAVTATASARGDQTIGVLTRPSPVASGQGVVVWESWDASAGGYRLQALQDGRVDTLAVAPSTASFDADVGPDSGGRPALVYRRCTRGFAGFFPPPEGCDLYTYSFLTGGERRIRSASSPTASEMSPTLWRGRLAWVRVYDRDRRADRPSRPFVYTRRLGSSRPSERLPGLPERRCEINFDRQRVCGAVVGTIDDLKLYGRRLAMTAFSTIASDLPSSSNIEVRLDTLGGDRARVEQLARQGRGEGGQTWIGPSFAEGWLYVYKTCFGDPGGCTRRAGAFRYNLSTGSWQTAPDTRVVSGFAVDSRATWVVEDPQAQCRLPVQSGREGVCPVVRRDPPPSYRATSAPGGPPRDLRADRY